MKNMILADTGFFIALGNKGDRDHALAIQIISTLNEPLITTYPVITETSYLLARDAGLAAQFGFFRRSCQWDISRFRSPKTSYYSYNRTNETLR